MTRIYPNDLPGTFDGLAKGFEDLFEHLRHSKTMMTVARIREADFDRIHIRYKEKTVGKDEGTDPSKGMEEFTYEDFIEIKRMRTAQPSTE